MFIHKKFFLSLSTYFMNFCFVIFFCLRKALVKQSHFSFKVECRLIWKTRMVTHKANEGFFMDDVRDVRYAPVETALAPVDLGEDG